MSNPLIFESERVISSAFIDSTVRMGVAQAVLLVQDNLTECFNALGGDGVVYRKDFGAFWVFTKTKVRFVRRPDFLVDEAKCGIAVPAGDSDALSEAVMRMSGMPEEELNRLGENGRRIYENNFAKELRMSQLEQLLMKE